MLWAAFFLILCRTEQTEAASLRLAWDPSTSPAVVGYRIHYGTQPGHYTKTLQVEGRLTSNAVIGDLEEGKAYFFAVTAYSANGKESAYSAEITNTHTKNQRKPRPGTSDNRSNRRQAPNLHTSQSTSHSIENDGQAPSQMKIPPSKTVARTPDGKVLPSR